jgi:signal transduction histidine kinase/DNA-binding response OmpR family regulator
VLAIAALVALVLVANGLVLALASRAHLRDDIQRHAQAYAQLSVGPICNAYETYYASGYSKFRELVSETIRLNPDLRRLSIYGTEGQVLFDSREFKSELSEPAPRAPSAEPDKVMLEAVKSMELSVLSSPEGQEAGQVVVTPYVEEWGRHRFSVAFYIVYDSLYVEAKAQVWRIFWLSLGSLALGVLIAILLSSQSLGPLEALTRGAQDLADGKLERRINLPTGDEFGALASTFHQMAEKLERTISDLETSNQTLGQMNLELQELDRLKSDLLANVSHELRTPLTAIQGYTEALGEGLLGQINDQQVDAVKVVQRNVQRLQGMIEQLLGFSRLESGLVRLDCSAFDLEEVVAHVAASVRAGRGPELNLVLDLVPGLPPVWGDPSRISQVIENLLTNAIKFTPSGGEIRVTVRRLAGDAEVVVADAGIGIPKEAQPKIFERFYQVDTSSTRRYGGMGLGLAIVKEILASHDRDIAVESEVGAGTRFRFTLPLAEPTAAAAPVDGGGRRIVLIDDDAGFRRELADFLGRAGFAVDAADNARDGFALATRVHPDMVVLDRLLPDGDGFELLTRLQHDPRTASTPLLVVSIRQERELGLRLGAAGYLVKPVEPAAVRDLILTTLRAPAASAEVLVVDGHAERRDLLLDRLRAEGLRARAAAGGAEALRVIGERPPALVLLEPAAAAGASGDLLARLRADPATATLPVILLGGPEDAERENRGQGLNVVDLAGKPLDVGSLIAEVERSLASTPRRAASA